MCGLEPALGRLPAFSSRSRIAAAMSSPSALAWWLGCFVSSCLPAGKGPDRERLAVAATGFRFPGPAPLLPLRPIRQPAGRGEWPSRSEAIRAALLPSPSPPRSRGGASKGNTPPGASPSGQGPLRGRHSEERHAERSSPPPGRFIFFEEVLSSLECGLSFGASTLGPGSAHGKG